MTDWQPIETAPKDGTPVLIVDDVGHIGLGVFGQYNELFESYGRGSAAWTGGLGGGVRLGYRDPEEAVGWMPLPPPPSS